MNGTEVVNDPRPEEFHLQTLHRAGHIAGAARQAGQAGSQGGIESFDVGGVDPADMSLGLNQQAVYCLPVSIGQASLDMGESFATVTLDDLNNIQFGPRDTPGSATLATVLGGKQLPQQFGIGCEAVNGYQDGLNDTPRSLAHLVHDLQEESLIPLQGNSAPNEQAGKDAQCRADPSRAPLQLDPHFVSLHLGQLDCISADIPILNSFSMVTCSRLPTGHGAFVDAQGKHDGSEWTTV